MPFVQLSKISLAFGSRDILKDVTLVLAEGTKAALAGANGCGKSTLMKIIAGLIHADSGEISCEKDTKVSYLPQSGIVHKDKTVYAEAESVFDGSIRLMEKMEELGSKMAAETDAKKAGQLAAEYHNLQTKLEDSGWNRRKGLIDEVLRGLGFSSEDFERLTNEFSGGWQMRIALAKILLSGADILILDEPTNYLDIEARTWLEAWLKKFSGGFLLVSHDRAFLDECVYDTYELFNGKLKKYKGSYTEYEKKRASEIETLIKSFEEQKEEIAKMEDFIRKFRYNASKAALVQDRIKRLEKIEPIEIPEHLKKIHFSFPPAPHCGNIVLKAESISKSYGGKKIIADLDMIVEKGERIAIAGRNGTGKTTLLRILSQADSDYSGNVQIGAGVCIGYFSQDACEQISGTQKIISLLESEAPMELIPKLRDMLAAFLFRGDDIYKSLSVLSGGEKSRLALLRLLLKPLNLLILDEPTNHLDIHSKDVLQNALQKFDGSVLFVSHDKAFIQSLATRVLELKTPPQSGAPSQVRNFPGSYSYYLYRIEKESKEAVADSAEQFAKPEQKKQGQLSYEEQKRLRAEKKKAEKQEAALLAEIEKCEEAVKEQEELLAKPEVYTNGVKSKEVQSVISALHSKIETLTAQWETLAAACNED